MNFKSKMCSEVYNSFLGIKHCWENHFAFGKVLTYILYNLNLCKLSLF